MKQLHNQWVMMVHAFQTKYGQSYNGGPRELPASLASFRKKLVAEEAQELVDAIDRGEIHEQLDAIVDLLYVVVGTANQMGFSDLIDEAFARVHHANMQKVLVESRQGSKRDSTWDIVKPEGWKKPVLIDLVTTEKENTP